MLRIWEIIFRNICHVFHTGYGIVRWIIGGGKSGEFPLVYLRLILNSKDCEYVQLQISLLLLLKLGQKFTN